MTFADSDLSRVDVTVVLVLIAAACVLGVWSIMR